jgi:hypothetical protein
MSTFKLNKYVFSHLSVGSPIDLMGEFSLSLTADLLIENFPALIGPMPEMPGDES